MDIGNDDFIGFGFSEALIAVAVGFDRMVAFIANADDSNTIDAVYRAAT